MAEAFPGNSSNNVSDEQRKLISVLLLATKWQFDTYGLSTVNKSLVNNLRVVDPEAKYVKITCAVVEEDRNIKDDQKEDAAKYGVELRGGKQPRGPRKKPNIEWLDQNIATYYPDLLRKHSYDFIIGHVPHLANGPLNLRDRYPEEKDKPIVILMIHDLPRTTNGDVDDRSLHEWLSEADVVFSVGKKVEAEIFSSILGFESCRTTYPQAVHPFISTRTLQCLSRNRERKQKHNIDDRRQERFRYQRTGLSAGCCLYYCCIKTHP